ncbi:hypothetical protein [Actinoallomurus iriomotensis]|uniref:Uncharacterized protein n=1 Tax=Actinoallomurus iriomotensis TaxID=478107 RepID=A0A9W6RPR3_9ACTN|nr:hypothetical protein [Actinoallomurus iriomotensis]GLY79756.1 hypothetical protein Airi01_080230 [Actinoallomurus iriomotensis]
MNDSTVRRIAGGAGLVAALLTLVEVPLYFVYDGPPPDANVLTRSLFGLVGLTFLAVFMVYLRPMLTRRDPRVEPMATLAAAAGLMWVTVEFVSNGLETGAVIQSAEPIDPTIAVSGTYLLYGTITRLIEALFLIAFAATVLRARSLPRWTAWSGLLLAAINLAFVPSIYFGNDPANFYAANGWGTTATMGGLFMLWLLATAIATLRAKTDTTTTAPAHAREVFTR